jgi:hypothetical protein
MVVRLLEKVEAGRGQQGELDAVVIGANRGLICGVRGTGLAWRARRGPWWDGVIGAGRPHSGERAELAAVSRSVSRWCVDRAPGGVQAKIAAAGAELGQNLHEVGSASGVRTRWKRSRK